MTAVPLRVCHLITGLDVGGAETMLWKVAARLQRRGQHHMVVSLTTEGEVAGRLRSSGMEVRALGLSRRLPNPGSLIRLVRWLRELKPAVVQTWLYHADLAGGVAAQLAGRIPVVWGLRQSNLDPDVNKPRTLRLARLAARLSWRLPERIVCCSQASREAHMRLGYAGDRMTVIPNGFDLETFRPNPEVAAAMRKRLGLPEDARPIGLFARYDPQKDHRTFVRAAALLGRARPAVRFVLAGAGITSDNAELASWLRESGMAERFTLLGRRDDMPALMAAMDVVASSSVGEGFPNVIGEAMACGVPCAVTDVGDSAELVGDTGRVVRPGDPEALARACLELLDLPPERHRALGAAARERVRRYYDLDQVAARYGSLYEDIADRVRTRRVS